MKPRLTKYYALALIAALSAAGAALGSVAALPPTQMQGSVSYVTGGIGNEEATVFRQAAAGYPLEVLFAEQTGSRAAFLSDVKIDISDRSGQLLLDTTSEGPFLLANLPAGMYKIVAEHEGARKSQTLAIRPGRHLRAVFVWTGHGNGANSAATD